MNAHSLSGWSPENPAFWQARGRQVAHRHLWISVPSLLVGFAVWTLWSVVVVTLPAAGFPFTTTQLFVLAAVPGLSGAVLRLVYGLTAPRASARGFTTLSTLALLLPALGVGIAVQHPGTPYWVMLAVAALCGLGGAAFVSSMTHLSALFPRSEVGSALSLNSGLGNLGVSVSQFLVPTVVLMSLFGAFAGAPQGILLYGEMHEAWLQNAGFVWIAPILFCAALAWFGMYPVPVQRGKDTASRVFTELRYWKLSLLYLGTFGSFIGLTAAFPLLAHTQFPEAPVLQYVFLAPLAGALARPLGGWLAGRYGGAVTTVAAFALMTASLPVAAAFLPSGAGDGSFWGVLFAFCLLFTAAGLGSGSMFFLVPDLDNRDAPLPLARRSLDVTGRAIGMISAVGALGGVAIPLLLALALAVHGDVSAALPVFGLFYLVCLFAAWRCRFRERPQPGS